MLASGFINPVIDVDRITATYDHAKTLLHDLKNIGAHNANNNRPRGLTGKAKLAAMYAGYEHFRQDDGRLPATWEVFYAIAWGPEAGQPIRTEHGDLATFSVESLRQSS